MNFRLVLFLLSASLAFAGYGQGDPRLEKLYTTYMAPCCWRDNLAEHDSPQAEQLRARIDGMVRAGQSDDQIKSVLVAEYGPRILTLPEGATRTWLFWTPALAAVLGIAAIAMWMRRARRSPLTNELAPADLGPDWDRD